MCFLDTLVMLPLRDSKFSFHLLLYIGYWIFSGMCGVCYSQNALVGSGFTSGWGGSSCPTGNGDFSYFSAGLGGSYGAILQAPTTGNRYFRLGVDWSGTTSQLTVNPGSDLAVQPSTEYTLNAACTTSGALYYNVPSTSYRYVFKTKNAGTSPSREWLFFEVQGAVREISYVSQMPASQGVSPASTVEVSAYTNGSLAVGQAVYLRYTTNNWSGSTIMPMTSNTTLHTATIPAFAAGTTVKYYVFTSGSNLTIPHDKADWYTINAFTNGGSNFNYTVTQSGSAATVTPSNPNDQVSVTVSFDATGTELEGSNKVYFHAGVGIYQAFPAQFHYTKGNWGQDDGVGEMTSLGGNIWQIVLSQGLRSYFGVHEDKDIFGLNFLFRNANGALKADNNGANFFHSVTPGDYFTMTSPVSDPHFAQINQNFDVTAAASTSASAWLLTEIHPTTGIALDTLASAGASISFSAAISVSSVSLRKFRLRATFGGIQKVKYFSVLGYDSFTALPRPSWVKPGINYHAGDPTRATLVLHAPTYTRFKKGNGTISGTGNTTPKNWVMVLGDFNGWMPSVSALMHRDRDGWDGNVDADGDGDRGDYWWIELSGLVPGQEYVFQYLVDGQLRVADPYTAKVSDPDDVWITESVYPGLIDHPSQASGIASVLQTSQNVYAWEASAFDKPTINRLHIYELLFRDFTDEGTYLAAIDKLDYIKGLGINAIHVMPVSEFEGNSSWGYNPNFFFAADKAYGPAEHLKKFVDECHKRNIQVFNDIVLNHAFYTNVMARLYWNQSLNRPAAENPWFNAEHRMVADQAGWWGADFNHESEHMQVFTDRVLDYWIEEFGFDGFRFDFTKGFGQSTPNPSDPWANNYNQDRIDLLMRMVNGVKSRHPGTVIIFEHLASNTEDKVLADQGILMWCGVGHHNDLKGFILGYNSDYTNLYESGVYNTAARNFAYANWMSYGESHDEERFGYELFQYFNGPRTLENIVKRLKLALGFNLLLPGPRMIWQMQELGYDYSVFYNGKTGEKPPRWDYFDIPQRKQLYNLTSVLLKLRNRYDIHATTPDYGNIGLGAGNIQLPRVMRLSSGNGSGAKHVIVVGNLDPVNGQDVWPGYDVAGTWYKYNGDPAVDGTSFSVTNQGSSYFLQPSEVVVLTNFSVHECTDVRSVADSGPNTLRGAVECAASTDTIVFEFPVYNQAIDLVSPLIINKNLTFRGFPFRNITISGTGLTDPVFSVSAGNTVTMDGLRITCSQGNAQGRCLVNSGVLTLSNAELDDLMGLNGSSVLNQGQGQIVIERNVSILR